MYWFLVLHAVFMSFLFNPHWLIVFILFLILMSLSSIAVYWLCIVFVIHALSILFTDNVSSLMYTHV